MSYLPDFFPPGFMRELIRWLYFPGTLVPYDEVATQQEARAQQSAQAQAETTEQARRKRRNHHLLLLRR